MDVGKWVAALLMLACAASGEALACTTSTWGGIGGGSPVAVEPPEQAGATRYSQRCALAGVPGTVGFVTTNAPADNIFRARFYVYTGTADASPTVFRATTADNNAGTQVVSVAYDGVLQRFRFVFVGGSVDAPAGTAPRNRWVAVEFFFQGGVPFQAWTTHRGVETPVVSAGNAGSATVGSASLGVVVPSAGSGAMYFDAFASDRGPSRIGPLCRGDANGDFALNTFDVSPIRAERVGGVLANSQPDCNEDGTVNVFDVACLHRRRLNTETCSLLGKSGWKAPTVIFSDGFESI